MLYDFGDNFLYCRLKSIRKKPGMWLGKKSLQLLDCYIVGCIDGYMAENNKKTDFFEWFNEFTRYVCKICVHGNECYGILNAIYECGYGDEEGFDYFFKLLDAFSEKHGLHNVCRNREGESYLKDEIKIVCFAKDEIYDMSEKYITEHMEEIFNLPQKKVDEKNDVSTGIRLCKVMDPKKSFIICAVYDSQFVNINEVVDKIEREKGIKSEIFKGDNSY